MRNTQEAEIGLLRRLPVGGHGSLGITEGSGISQVDRDGREF